MNLLNSTAIILCLALSSAYGEADQALDNSAIYKLARNFHDAGKEREKLIGQRIRIRVEIHKREDGTALGEITNPKKEFEPTWMAHLTNFRKDFFENIEPEKEYVIAGVIVEDRMDYGAFWIYVNDYEEVEPASIVNDGAAPHRE